MKDKKRKAASKDDEDAIPAKKKFTQKATKKEDSPTKDTKDDASFTALTLQDIHDRIKDLSNQIPTIPDEGFYTEGSSPSETSGVIGQPPHNLKKALLKSWACQMQCVLEELGLVLCCVSTATYRWGTDRSGAADQNLTLLNEELNNTQEQISAKVSPRLRNVLTPVVDLVVDKTIVSKAKRPKTSDNGDTKVGEGEDEIVEIKTNVFKHHLEDPDFVHLCYEILARNAPMLRVVVVSNLQKMLRCITDYLAANTNDTQHHREFAY